MDVNSDGHKGHFSLCHNWPSGAWSSIKELGVYFREGFFTLQTEFAQVVLQLLEQIVLESEDCANR